LNPQKLVRLSPTPSCCARGSLVTLRACWHWDESRQSTSWQHC
jgi:hypothetical protein